MRNKTYEMYKGTCAQRNGLIDEFFSSSVFEWCVWKKKTTWNIDICASNNFYDVRFFSSISFIRFSIKFFKMKFRNAKCWSATRNSHLTKSPTDLINAHLWIECVQMNELINSTHNLLLCMIQPCVCTNWKRLQIDKPI